MRGRLGVGLLGDRSGVWIAVAAHFDSGWSGVVLSVYPMFEHLLRERREAS